MADTSGQQKQVVAIVGLGLIGASLALALRGKYRVAGCSRSRATERYALERGIVDEIRPVDRLKGVSCVVVCTPLSALRDTVKQVYDVVGDESIITDVGSVKGLLCGLPGRIVGGHPMAGTEHSGINAAKRHLFENAVYCVVPYPQSRSQDVEFVKELARAAKAKPLEISAEKHDRLVAYYSHMPHMAAYALSGTAIGEDVSIAGSGFMDSTRVACSDPDFWTEVFRLNRDNTLSALDGYISVLNDMRGMLADNDYSALNSALADACSRRKTLAAARVADSGHTVTVDVLDEVGSLGAVASLLAESGANIANIGILDSREGIGGALVLSFTTPRDASLARKALTAAGYCVS